MSKKEDNHLIAEFLGWERRPMPVYLDGGGDMWMSQHTAKTFCSVVGEELFHRSWDWLIPVFQKIMDICLNYEDDYGDFYAIKDCIPDINQTYKAIVEFIKMYNEKQKSN